METYSCRDPTVGESYVYPMGVHTQWVDRKPPGCVHVLKTYPRVCTRNENLSPGDVYFISQLHTTLSRGIWVPRITTFTWMSVVSTPWVPLMELYGLC